MFENYIQTAPHKNYIAFFTKMEGVNTLKTELWTYIHIIGYFVKKYEELYKRPYKFKYNKSSTSDCYEAFRVKSCFNHISSDPVIIKNYIDWLFEKIKKEKRKISSIIVLVKEEYMNEYKMKYLFNEGKENISRATKLPDNYIDILKDNGYNIETYGQLVFLYNADSKLAIELFKKFDNFDKSILDKII